MSCMQKQKKRQQRQQQKDKQTQQQQQQQQQQKQQKQQQKNQQCIPLLLRRNRGGGGGDTKFAISFLHCKVAQLSLLFLFILTTTINQTESSKIVQALEAKYKETTTPTKTTSDIAAVIKTSGNATEIHNYNYYDGNDKPFTVSSGVGGVVAGDGGGGCGDSNSSSSNSGCATDDRSSCLHRLGATDFSSFAKEVVERLIKKWAPIVWLAPEEKFMPLGVEEFLEHVHPIDKDKTFIPGMPIGDRSEKAYLVTNAEIDELLKNESSFIYGRNPNKAPVPIYAVVTLCNKTKDNKLTKNSLPEVHRSQADIQQLVASSTRGPYIPLSFDIIEERNSTMRRSSRLYPIFKKAKRSVDRETDDPVIQQRRIEYIPNPSNDVIELSGEEQISTPLLVSPPLAMNADDAVRMNVTKTDSNDSTENVNKFIANLADNVKFSTDLSNNIDGNDEDKDDDNANDRGKLTNQSAYNLQTNIPAFHVSYWMFYPYSQGKTMCTLNLGPLGHIPFPALYGFCLGRRKDIGSHIGDWEHMSIYFNGAAEPEALYVSAHDAGAYYTFNRLTGSFEFKKQETRKGILQRPNFPKTVTTFNNHPVLFAAKGSHGLWTAPGKHRFVKVARLYDVNGFGTLWNTRKAIQISYENIKSHGRSLSPTWLSFKGKWGNPKSNCHPFRRIGLNFCEFTDGPTGIPLKESHFKCGATFR